MYGFKIKNGGSVSVEVGYKTLLSAKRAVPYGWKAEIFEYVNITDFDGDDVYVTVVCTEEKL